LTSDSPEAHREHEFLPVSTGWFWPNPAARVSLAGYPAGKFTDGHYRQEPTRDGFFR